MGIDRQKLWVGPAVKIGGTMIAAGLESVTGVAFWAKNWSANYNFDIQSARFGLGVGGGATVCVMVAYNVVGLSILDGSSQNGWDFNISIPGASIGLGKLKAEFECLKEAAGAGAAAVSQLIKGKMNPSLAATLFGLGESVASSATSARGAGAGPAVLVIPIPGLGGGVEVSLHGTFGRMSVYK